MSDSGVKVGGEKMQHVGIRERLGIKNYIPERPHELFDHTGKDGRHWNSNWNERRGADYTCKRLGDLLKYCCREAA